MKLPDDFWAINDEDREQGWAKFLAAFAVLVIWGIAGYLWLVTLWAAQ